MSRATRSVFVSHSQHDRQLTERLGVIASTRGVKLHLMEYENRPTSRTICRAVQRSHHFLLLITDNVHQRRHTSNWVSFELGMAYAFGLPVTVLESATVSQFAIPYVNNYIKTDLNIVSDAFLRSLLAGQWPSAGKRLRCDCCGSSFRVRTLSIIACPVCREPLLMQRVQ
jgi:hypothetical protein